jgi:hypothetical protein
LQERTNTSLVEFPHGEGPPLFLSSSFADWATVAPGQGAHLALDGGRGGVYATGLVGSTAVIWALLSNNAEERAAYCYHAVGNTLDPRAHGEAIHALGGVNAFELFVVLAARHGVAEGQERFFTTRGVRHDRVFTYSNGLLPQFGISAKGCVGEAR